MLATGWKVVLRNESKLELGEEFNPRYPNVPEDYLEFLQRVALCTNAAENVWFLLEGDYNGTGEAE